MDFRNIWSDQFRFLKEKLKERIFFCTVRIFGSWDFISNVTGITFSYALIEEEDVFLEI